MKGSLEKVRVAGIRAISFEDRGRSYETRNVGISRRLRRKGNTLSPRGFRRKETC